MKYKNYNIYYDKFEDVYYVEINGKRLWSHSHIQYIQEWIDKNLK